MKLTTTLNSAFSRSAATPRGNELFRQNEHEVHVRTDRFFAWLMALQWVAGVIFSIWISPVAWKGTSSSVHPHVLMAVFIGGLITSLPIFLALKYPGTVVTRHTIAVGQVLMSALYIHLMGGRIETHFHVFGSLAFLAFYRDWRVLISASVVVALDHFFRGLYFPMSVYGEVTGVEWRWLEHAAWVVFMDVFLFIGTAISLQEMRTTADRQARLEEANAAIKEATAELEQKTSLLNSIMAGMGEGVIAANEQGEIILTNPAADALLGKEFLDVPYSEWSEGFGIFQEEGQAHCRSEELPLAKAIRGESVDSEELLVKRGDFRGPVWLEVSGRPLRDLAGGQTGGLVVFREVTERKRLMAGMQRAQEHAESANRAKSEFLSRMSHELRTPLNSVIGFAQLMELAHLPGKCTNYVSRIQQAGHHLLGLINEILDIARIEVGKLSLSSEPVHLESSLSNAVALVAPLARERNVRVHLLESGEETYVRADKQRLSQILLNVLSNAIKYNRDDGSVTVSVSMTLDKVTIGVTDTGCGIEQHQVHKLFQPFERLGAEQRPVEGTGLGLAVSKGLAEAMGGSLYLKSNTSMGTTFELSLAIAAKPQRLASESLVVSNSLVSSTGATVLLVEDNPANIHLMEEIFSELPTLTLHVADHAADGVKLARQIKPDLILLDLHLPDHPGSWVLECIQQIPGCEHIPVLVVSADATERERDRLLAKGAVAYITKPFQVQELLAIVEGLVNKERPAA